MFYLQEKGVPLGLDFEPYSYGPFSRQLMETASEMQRSGEVIVGRTEYSPGPGYCDRLPEQESRKIDGHLQRFSGKLRHDFSFDNLNIQRGQYPKASSLHY
jgi:uncharacterized protein YwgA